MCCVCVCCVCVLCAVCDSKPNLLRYEAGDGVDDKADDGRRESERDCLDSSIDVHLCLVHWTSHRETQRTRQQNLRREEK